MRPLPTLTLSIVLLASLVFAAPAESDESPQRTFASAVKAVQNGAYTEAIDTFELLADRGFSHPDASFDRAFAYVERARSHQAVVGDLGRAAAALCETLALRPGDREAEVGLERIRAEIARRHVREGVAPVLARPSLSRAVTSLLDENTWAELAALGSLLLALGLALRRFAKQTSAALAGAIAIGVGAPLLVGTSALAAGARHFRLTSSPAVIVASEARLLDESGKPLPQKRGAADSVTVPEGASVYVLERRPNLDRVEWGSAEGWLTPSEVEVIETR
jgi:hypothetical protein